MTGLSKQQLLAAAAGAVITVALGAGALTFAQSAPSSTAAPATHMPPGVGGTVTAVSGNTITVKGQNGTTYTINAGSATITKDETVSVADVAVGDTVEAQGTVSGTSVNATSIHDGKAPQGFGGGQGAPGMGMMGRGGVFGTVSAVSGSTLTVISKGFGKNASTTTTYTVDASSATVLKGSTTPGTKPAASTLSAVAVGDTVMIQGTVSGSSVTAKTIVDGMLGVGGPRGGAGWGGKKPTTTTTTTQ